MVNSNSAVRFSSLALAVAAVVALAAPADAASANVDCPSSACVQVASGLGDAYALAPDNQGAVYVTYGEGVLRKVTLATGSVSTVATGLGNLRGLAVSGGSAYVASFDGTLQQVNLTTGSHRTLASGLSSLFGVGRYGNTTYATDGQGRLIAVPDGGSAHVVATVGFSVGIAFDAAGNAYTASMGANEIVRTDVATGATRSLAEADYEPTSISVGSDGLVYFEVGGEVVRLNPITGVESNVTELENINGFEFALATSGNAYEVYDDVLWQINDLIGR
jgi:streptogramin lyase